MTGPDESSAVTAGPAETSNESSAEVAPWRAPRWLLLAAAVVLVVGLVVLRALLNGDDGKDDADKELPAPEEVAGAEGFAEEVLTAWSRPEADYDTWWEELRPLLTPRAREGYEFTDPRRVPDLTISGDPEAVAGPTRDTVTIKIPTDAGSYAVALYRPGEDAEWRAVQIIFPDQPGPFR